MLRQDWGSSGEGSGDENCALLGWGGDPTWFDGECDSRLRCVCEHSDATALPPPPPTTACPPGWTAAAGTSKCYNRVTTGTPDECHAACNAVGGELPCVENAQENSALASIAGVTASTCGWQSQSNCVWIGLYQSDTTHGAASNWDAWYGGQCHSSFRRWFEGQPADDSYDPVSHTTSAGGGDENCAVMGFGGLSNWWDAPCQMRSACICERRQGAAIVPAPALLTAPPSQPPPSPLQPARGCPAGWVGGTSAPGHKCYKRLEYTNSAEGCDLACRLEDEAEQLCPASSEENAYVATYVLGLRGDRRASNCNMQTQTGCAWLGLFQGATTQGADANWNGWRGSRCSSDFRNWNAGQPDDLGRNGAGSGDQNCAFMGWNGGSGWNDGYCTMRATCVCELPSGHRSGAASAAKADDGPSGGEVFLIVLNVLLLGVVGGLVYKYIYLPRSDPRARTVPNIGVPSFATTTTVTGTPYQAPMTSTMNMPLAANDGAAAQQSTV